MQRKFPGSASSSSFTSAAGAGGVPAAGRGDNHLSALDDLTGPGCAVRGVRPVWKSTSVSGAHFGDDAAVLAPSSGEEGHRHAIEQASRLWRGGRLDVGARKITSTRFARHHVGVAHHPGALARRAAPSASTTCCKRGRGLADELDGRRSASGGRPGARRRAGPDAGAAARLRGADAADAADAAAPQRRWRRVAR